MIHQQEMLQIGISEQRQEIDKIYSLGMKVVVFLSKTRKCKCCLKSTAKASYVRAWHIIVTRPIFAHSAIHI